jgi:hypothetical protein
MYAVFCGIPAIGPRTTPKEKQSWIAASPRLTAARRRQDRRNPAPSAALLQPSERPHEQQDVPVPRRASACLGPSSRTAGLAAGDGRSDGALSHREGDAAARLAGRDGAPRCDASTSSLAAPQVRLVGSPRTGRRAGFGGERNSVDAGRPVKAVARFGAPAPRIRQPARGWRFALRMVAP